MSKRKKSVLARIRYDRIFLVLLVLNLLIFAIIRLKSCHSDVDADPVAGTPVAAATEPTEPDHTMDVFLSPSNQRDNEYACGNATEASAMRTIANQVKKNLEADGINVYIAGEEDTLQDKVNTANGLGVGTYVAIHSNAGGTSGDGQGTELYYNPETPGSRMLGKAVYDAVADLTPTKDRDMQAGTGGENRELYEVINPEMACCLLEVEFHDQTALSQWILDHSGEIAAAITRGIEQYRATLIQTTAPPAVSDTTTTEVTTVG